MKTAVRYVNILRYSNAAGGALVRFLKTLYYRIALLFNAWHRSVRAAYVARATSTGGFNLLRTAEGITASRAGPEENLTVEFVVRTRRDRFLPGDATDFLTAVFDPAAVALRVDGKPAKPLRSAVENVGFAAGEDHWLVTLVARTELPPAGPETTVVLEAGNAQATFAFDRGPEETEPSKTPGVMEFVRRLRPEDFK